MSLWWLNMPNTMCPGGCGGWSWECMCHLYDGRYEAEEAAYNRHMDEYYRQMAEQEAVDYQNDYELNGCGFDRIAMGM